ncbi:MAG: 23S rRNA (adenine(2503)-C(2))-methyltransferase RlmN [Desulfobacterales bacterium]|nr:23S rRNA (adenine(2503)-C(2))-methyltransferase RlmN [Desulfobacterales bacterium]
MNVFAMTCAELADEMSRRYGKGIYHAAAIYRELFKRGNTSFAEAPEFLKSPLLAVRLAEDVALPCCRIIARQEEGGVVKFSSALVDGHLIESVIIPSRDRTTLCISSQVGCRMGCRFCVTGGMGFVRDLTVEEIVWQVFAARFILDRRIDNLVFMGMGEPLDNFDNLMQAVRVISDQRGVDIAHGHITISTAGHADGIRKLAALNLRKLRLAVSLNAADDGLRSTLMPINRLYPLARIKEELKSFPLGKSGVIFIEYVLLAGVNDAREQADQLVGYLEGIPARVNVIAYNRGASAIYSAPPPEQVHRFCGWLADRKIFVRLRQSRGQGIMAACGQLGASLPAGRRVVRETKQET